MFKLKNYTLIEKREIINILKSKLEELPQLINEIKSLEVGINVLESNRAYDFVLISDFDDLQSLEKYRVHPEHVEFVDFFKQYRENSICVDYEYFT
jgi:hypothetical protein